MNGNQLDLFPVCQARRARIERDPRAAAQWRALVAELFSVFAKQPKQPSAVSRCVGCPTDHEPPGTSASS